MDIQKLPSLMIGDLEVNPPIIQGGMGVRVSGANLTAAVANQGCVGVIASVGLGIFEVAPREELIELNNKALKYEIEKARSLTDGIVGVNIMVALSNYQNLLTAAVEADVDLIISGAGLPLNLPEFAKGTNIKLIPIVSSAKALKVLLRKWKRDYDRIPDAVVVEGVKAGGHLGFKYQDILDETTLTLERLVEEVLEVANSMKPHIPVIAAGGIYDGSDIARFLELGASGVQLATRFVCTHECDVHENFKQAYLHSKENDMTIIKSPVGMPGRVIKNKFVERIIKGETVPFKCVYRCLRTCDPQTAPYCIAKVLTNAAEGNMEEAFVFAGENAYKCNEIVSVKSLIDQLTKEAIDSMS